MRRNCNAMLAALAACALLGVAPFVQADEGLSADAATVNLRIERPPPGRLPWQVFDERTGLPQHTIVDLLADDEGYVWAATQDGLARYNGHTWETVALPQAMGSNYPRVMRRASAGGLWIGSFDGGLAHWRDGQWRIIGQQDGLPSNRIRGLLETRANGGITTLWIATDRGVARLQAGRIRVFDLSSGLPSLDTEALFERTDAQGRRRLLVGTANGLAQLDGERFLPVPVPKALLGHRIDDIVESPGLRGGPALWIASYGAGIGVLEGGRWTLLDTGSGLPSNVEVFTKGEADDGSPMLWIGSEGGLLRFQHGRFTLFDESSGLPIRIIWKVLETTTPGGLKTLWLGTWGGGVVRLSPNAWRAFDAGNGLPTGSATSVLLSRNDDGQEEVWAGTSDGGLARFAGERFESVPLPEPLRHSIIFSLMETRAADGARQLWVASFGGGIGRLERGRWTLLDTSGLPNRRIYQLAETSDDDGRKVVWAATEGGLARLQDGRWMVYREGRQLPSDIATQMVETTSGDGKRTLWVGTSKGLARFESGQWRIIDRSQGLRSDNISSLQATQSADGTRWLWAGTLAGGAFRLRLDDPAAKPESFSTRSRPALPSDTVQSVAEDRRGRIYLCTTRGVARLTPRQPTRQQPEAFALEVFTTEDGLPSSDCQQGARLVDEHGRVWMGTARGLAMLDPREERVDNLPKPLRIDRAELASSGKRIRSGDSLAHSEGNLRFTGALLAYNDESRIRYRYQLEGFDARPSDWLATRSKEYTNLGAGRYRFLLWGRDARGNVSGPVALPFSVRPAPWLSLWAFLAYAALLMLAAYGAMRWRFRAMARRTHELETEVAARTRDLSAARDELQRLASEDALTGVANRRKFDAFLGQEWRRAQAAGERLTLVQIDVDYFKAYNDRYGHGSGDACLRAVAQALMQQGRSPADLVARYGGEEFVMLLAEGEPERVSSRLRALLAAVDALHIPHAGSACGSNVSISLGAVTLQPVEGMDAQHALQRADALLYQAKIGGRHRGVYEAAPGDERALP